MQSCLTDTASFSYANRYGALGRQGGKVKAVQSAVNSENCFLNFKRDFKQKIGGKKFGFLLLPSPTLIATEH